MLQDINIGASSNDKTGTPARQAGQIINDNFKYLENKITRKDSILETTGLAVSGQDVTMNAFWSWMIDTIEYTNPVDVVINFPYAASGNSRLDIIALTTSNTAIRIPGEESESNPVSPPLPENMLQASLVLVTDSSVGEPSAPITGNAYIEKIESSELVSTGGHGYLQFSSPGNSCIRFVGAETYVDGVYLFPEYLAYSGKKLTFKNFQATDITVKHLGPDDINLNTKFWFPTETDLVLKPGQIVEFAYSFTSGRFEFIGSATDLTNYYTKTEVDAKVIGLWDDRGSFDASVNAYPSSGGSGISGAILKGDIWTISVAGILPTGQNVEIGDTVRSLIDAPGNTQTNWSILQNNIGYVAENSTNKTDDETTATTSSSSYFSVKGYWNATLLKLFSNAPAKSTTLVDADLILAGDSADSFKTKTRTFAQLKDNLKTYYDTLYQVILVSGTNIKTINGTSILGSGNISVAASVNIVEVSKTTSFTVTDTDATKLYVINSASAVTVTLPSGLTTGNWWEILNIGVGVVSFVASGSTIISPDNRLKIRTQYSSCRIIARASNQLSLGGDLAL